MFHKIRVNLKFWVKRQETLLVEEGVGRGQPSVQTMSKSRPYLILPLQHVPKHVCQLLVLRKLILWGGGIVMRSVFVSTTVVAVLVPFLIYYLMGLSIKNP